MSAIAELNKKVRRFREEVLKNNTVLVVDDEDVVLMVMEELLGDEWDVVTSSTAEKGFSIVEKRRPNVILTDKNLPGMDGIELLRRVKNRWKDLEALIITGYASLDSALEAIDLGAFDYITKPFDSLDIVKDKVRRAIKKQNEYVINMKIVEEFKNFASQIVEEAREIAPDIMEHFQQELKKLKEKIREKNSVLVLDGNVGSLNACTRYIREMGFEVNGVGSPAEALSFVNERNPEVLVMEKETQDYHFVDFIKNVKSISPDTDIIVYTYFASLQEIIEAMDAGISDYAVRDLEGFVFLGRKLKKVMANHTQRLKFKVLVSALKELTKKALRTIKETPFFEEVSPFEKKEVKKVIEEKVEEKKIVEFREELIEIPRFSSERERILVVDDEEVVRDVVKELLEEHGFIVDEAGKAEEALNMVDERKYSVYIVDKNLPGMSGLDFVGRVKEKDELAEAVIITGYESLESVLIASQLGVCEYITKPFVNLGEIIEAVNRTLEKRKEKVKIYQELKYLQEEYEKLKDRYGGVVEKIDR